MHGLCESGELDFDEIKERLVETKLSADADEDDIRKLLYKHGF